MNVIEITTEESVTESIRIAALFWYCRGLQDSIIPIHTTRSPEDGVFWILLDAAVRLPGAG